METEKIEEIAEKEKRKEKKGKINCEKRNYTLRRGKPKDR